MRDGGATWRPQTSGVEARLWIVTFQADGATGRAVGENGAVLRIAMPDMNAFEPAQSADALGTLFKRLNITGVPEVAFRDLQLAEQRAASLKKSKTTLDETAETFKGLAFEDAPQLNVDYLTKPQWDSWLHRIGIVALLLFLVTILVNLYRYSMRVAAFYDARADAILALAIRPDGTFNEIVYDGLVKALDPGPLDFGKPANMPTAQAVDLAKSGVGAVKR
jgi:hypothetical protein